MSRLASLPGAKSSSLALCALLAASAARADDSRYQDFPVGSRATALGGAFVALSDDPSGLYYNPAGICDARRLNVSVSASLYGFERQSRGRIRLAHGTFSLATLDTLNVIPGEAGLLKGVGTLDDRGTPFAFGFDVTVPQFRSYGVDSTTPVQAHSRVTDRTFAIAAGAGFRYDKRLNLGVALHYVLRLFESTDDALALTGNPNEPTVGAYHADGAFQNANLVALVGAKLRLGDEWIVGASLGLPGIALHDGGKVSIQDVVADPQGPPGARSTATVIDTTDVSSATPQPWLLRAGVARVMAHRWTLSGQATLHGSASYDRFTVPAAVAQRLRLQTHVERSAVLDLNAGGEYLLDPEYSLALGFFTDRTGAPQLSLQADGSLDPRSSRLPDVSLYGGTATVGLIGQHAISRLGVSVSYGSGEDAAPNDPSGTVDPKGYSRASVHQLFLYFFLASTFRY